MPSNNDPTSWLDFLTSNSSQTPTNAPLNIGLPTPTPTASRAASNSVSSVSSSRTPYGMPSAASSAESLRLSSSSVGAGMEGMRMSPSRKRTRDEMADGDDQGRAHHGSHHASLGMMGMGAGKLAVGVEVDGERRSLG